MGGIHVWGIRYERHDVPNELHGSSKTCLWRTAQEIEVPSWRRRLAWQFGALSGNSNFTQAP